MGEIVVQFNSKTETILKYKDVRMLRSFLYGAGFWPGEVLGEKIPLWFKIYRKIIIVQTFIILLAECLYIHKYKHEMDFLSKGYNVLIIFFTVLVQVRVFYPSLIAYGAILQKFFFSFHLGNRENNTEYDQKVFEGVQKVSNIISYSWVVMMYLGMALFSVFPTYLNYKNGFYSGHASENATYNCLVCFTIPKIVDTHNFSVLSTIFNLSLAYITTISIAGIDLVMFEMALQIIGHIFILRNGLETMPSPKKSTTHKSTSDAVDYFDNDEDQSDIHMFDEEENKLINEKLVDFVKHHRMIVSFTEDLSDTFGLALGLNYGFNLVSCCILLLMCSSSDEAMIRYGPLTANIFGQLVTLSVVFEVIGTVSEKLKDSVYYTPWEYMNSRNRKTICFMLARFQRPINVTTMGLVKVGVGTMGQILKATMSYFTLLRSFN